MRNAAQSLLCLAVAALAGLGAPRAWASACELKLDASLAIARLPGAAQDDPPPVVVAARHEDTPLQLIFDTGAATTLIEGSVPGFIGLHRFTESVANGAGGGIALRHVTNLSLTLGDLTVTIASVAVTDPRTPLYGGQFDGLLGVDALRAYDFELDPAAGRIRIFSQDHCRSGVVYWAREYSEFPFHRDRDGRIAVPVTIDGKTLRGIIDTGASHTSMNWQIAADAFGLTPTSPGVMAVTHRVLSSDGRQLAAARYQFDTVEFGALRIHNAPVTILPTLAPEDLPHAFSHDDEGPQIAIGMDVLQHLRFYVANGEEMIYFTIASPPA